MHKNKMELLGGTLVGMMFLSGCSPATATDRTPTAEGTSTLVASPLAGSGEFADIYTPNSLQNLDNSTKEIVSKNLELIAGVIFPQKSGHK